MPRIRTLVIVLAGGAGGRLELLTRERAKPAVPYAGTHRLIDFPLSNCRNSGLADVWVQDHLAIAHRDLRGVLALRLDQRDAIPGRHEIVLVLPARVVADAEREREFRVDRADVREIEAGPEMRPGGALVRATAAGELSPEHRDWLDAGEQAEDAVRELRFAA